MSTPTVELDAQYRQLREECGLVRRPGCGVIEVIGADAAEYLQSQLTNDVEVLTPGAGCYAALLDRKGHMQTDMRVLRFTPDEFIVFTEPEGLEKTLHHLRTYSIGREVEIRDRTETGMIVSLLGPRSSAVVEVAGATEHDCETTTVRGTSCILVRTAEGFDLWVGADHVPELVEALTAAGAVEVSPEAAEIVRIEAGRPRFGAEMGTETMPAEAGIVERAVSFTKGCYIGQETVARLHYKGKPNRHLRGLRFSGPARPGERLVLGEKEVGTVGSAALSPALGPIGLAILRREAEPGATVAVGEDGVTAEVVALPFG